MAPAVVVDVIEFEKLGYGLATALAHIAAVGGEDLVPEFPMRSPVVLQAVAARLLAGDRRLAATAQTSVAIALHPRPGSVELRLLALLAESPASGRRLTARTDAINDPLAPLFPLHGCNCVLTVLAAGLAGPRLA
jgi:hypothetical protein